MKYFDSITKALTEVRNRANGFTDNHDEVFLFIDYWREGFYVTEDAHNISEKLEQTYFENGCEPEPETLARECIVIKYTLASNKEIYPFLNRNFKKPTFKSKVDLIRGRIGIEPEYSLDFNIG